MEQIDDDTYEKTIEGRAFEMVEFKFKGAASVTVPIWYCHSPVKGSTISFCMSI